MNGNPYYIKPADLTPGFQGLMQGFAKRGEFEREKAKETANLKMRDEVLKLSTEGTPEQIQSYIAKNPSAKGVYDELVGTKNDITKQAKIDAAYKMWMGEDPTKALIDSGEVIVDQGGDITQTVEAIKQSAADPEGMKERGKRMLAFWAPEKLKSILAYEEGERKAAEATAEAGAPLLLKDFNQEKINEMALTVADTGEYPFSGRSDDVREANARLKSIAMDINKERGISDVQGRFAIMDRKGMTTDINAQQKKLGSMRSFGKNIDKQVAKLKEVGKRIRTLDNRLLNIGKNKMLEAVGDPDRAVLKLLMGELEEEIGKLASGATDSVAALTDSGREKWRKIFDPNLSFTEMMQVVDESKHVAHMRVESMVESLAESKRIRSGTSLKKKATPAPVTKYTEGQTATGAGGEKMIYRNGNWEAL